MKFIFSISVLLLLTGSSFAMSGKRCDKHCKDYNQVCGYLYPKCKQNPFIKLQCPMTCKFCKVCDGPEKCKPENDPCKDTIGNCQIFKEKGFCNSTTNLYYKNNCRKTCEVCKPCSVPKKVKCQKVCEDKSSVCSLWVKQGYCKPGSFHLNYMKKNCAKSCQACVKCKPVVKTTKSPRTTRKPYGATRKPYGTTRRPYGTTRKPYGTKRPSTTRKPYGTTRKPYGTTRKPYGTKRPSTTRKPYGTTRKPYGTTRKPYGTTRKPYGTTRKPYGTTRKPYGTTRKPYTRRPYTTRRSYP